MTRFWSWFELKNPNVWLDNIRFSLLCLETSCKYRVWLWTLSWILRLQKQNLILTYHLNNFQLGKWNNFLGWLQISLFAIQKWINWQERNAWQKKISQLISVFYIFDSKRTWFLWIFKTVFCSCVKKQREVLVSRWPGTYCTEQHES